MLATSRSASICSSFRSRTSSMPPPMTLDEPAGVQNQRRDPVAHDGRSAEHRQRPLRRGGSPRPGSLLAQHAVHHESPPAGPHLVNQDNAPGGGLAPLPRASPP